MVDDQYQILWYTIIRSSNRAGQTAECICIAKEFSCFMTYCVAVCRKCNCPSQILEKPCAELDFSRLARTSAAGDQIQSRNDVPKGSDKISSPQLLLPMLLFPAESSVFQQR